MPADHPTNTSNLTASEDFVNFYALSNIISLVDQCLKHNSQPKKDEPHTACYLFWELVAGLHLVYQVGLRPRYIARDIIATHFQNEVLPPHHPLPRLPSSK